MNDLQGMPNEALLQMTNAETENQVSIAKRYPRDITTIKKKVLAYAACDEQTAASCFYKKPVDNKGTLAEGPSIRLAEIIAATYQNIKYGSRIIDISEKWVTVQGVAVDLESNLSYTSEVKRSIWSEKGAFRYSQSLIETTIKAACAFAVRDAIFKIVPMGIFNAELKEIKRVAIGGNSGLTMTQRVANALAYFLKLGVTEKRVMERLEVENRADISEDHLETLVGLKTGIEQKEFSIDEAFNPGIIRKESKEAAVKTTMSNIAAEAKAATTAKAPDTEPDYTQMMHDELKVLLDDTVAELNAKEFAWAKKILKEKKAESYPELREFLEKKKAEAPPAA